ncbi:hypothetical protein RA27_22095 [Ruegeria sp. ANG-R]|uniref:hypothetical protein n=1 Tax=Ruegeria sp. ANG-R TaxID=1577903 RepID=UPI00057F1123|nr:hypothetical protein [Ruegeria sp. ANG-R]KIC36450.1 hypothetical protein RA27_22095 [Ruegeria sp. ANG-R]
MYLTKRCVFVSVLGACLGASTSTFAQETGACGQPSNLVQQHLVIEGAEQEAFNLDAHIMRGEPVYFELSFPVGAHVNVETTLGEQDSETTDPLLLLFDSDGEVISRNDDGGRDTNSRLDVRIPEGRYCLQVSTVPRILAGVGLPGGFDATIPILAHVAAVEYADQPIDISYLNAEVEQLEFSGSMALQDDMSHSFDFELTEAMPVVFEAHSNDFDTVLQVYDRFGDRVAHDDDGGQGTNSLIRSIRPLPVGRYTVAISSLNREPGFFRIHVGQNVLDEEPADAVAETVREAPSPQNEYDQTLEQCREAEFAGLVQEVDAAESEPYRTFANVQNTTDVALFELPETMKVRLTTTSGDVDTELKLYALGQSSLNLIGQNDDADGLGRNSRLEQQLPSGKYCIEFGGLRGEGTGNVELEIVPLSDAMLQREAVNAGHLVPNDKLGLMTDLGTIQSTILKSDFVSSQSKWYEFNVDEFSLLVVRAAALGNPVKLILYDTERPNQKIAESTNQDGLFSQVMPILEPGNYALAVVNSGSGSSSAGAIQLSMQRFVSPSE